MTHFVSMMGTSGTFVGTTRRLKELNPAIRCISLQPDSPFHGIEGAKHMASAIVPEIYDTKLADEDIGISTEESYAWPIDWLARKDCWSEFRPPLQLLAVCKLHEGSARVSAPCS